MAAYPCRNTLPSGAECGASKNHAVHGRFHREYHEYMRDKPVGLQPMSAGMRAFRRESGYEASAKEAQGKPCQVLSPVCTGYAEHLHEPLSRGRAGGLKAALRDGPAPIPCCDRCNSYISENPTWAREQGLLVSRKDLRIEL